MGYDQLKTQLKDHFQSEAEQLVVELERLTCNPGKVREYNASFDKLAPSVLQVIGLD